MLDVRRTFIALCLLAAGSGRLMDANAQTPRVISAGPDEIAVTIYPDDLAMITETRTVTLPAGRSKIALAGVSDQMIPQSALLTEFGAVTIERNFDFDLLAKASLFENAVGREVTLIRTAPGSGEVRAQRATILAGTTGVVFKTEDGIERFQCSGLSERVQFDGLPDGLRAEPTLSLTVDAAEAGPQTFVFRYLASGYDWRADYILTLTGKKRASMLAWLTATNGTGVSIRNAELSIISGELSRLDDTEAPEFDTDAFVAQCLPPRVLARSRGRPQLGQVFETVVVTGSRLEANAFNNVSNIAEREDLGDYKLYRVPFRTNLAANQTKQVRFIDKPRIKLARRYAFDFSQNYNRIRLDDDSERKMFHAIQRFDIDNSRGGRLAEPLPAGFARIMIPRANGQSHYVGGEPVESTAIGAPAIIDAGFTSEVAMASRRLYVQPVRGPDGRTYRPFDQELEFINTSDETVSVEFSMALDPSEKVSEASIKPRATNPVATWRFKVRANASHMLTFHVGPD